jgi:hypothetical protein
MIKHTPAQHARLKAAKQNDSARRQKELAREEEVKKKARDSLKAAKARDKKRRGKS